MGIIFLLSHQKGPDSQEYSRIILYILDMLHVELDNEGKRWASWLFRKTAHFVEYAVLFFLLFRLMTLYIKYPKSLIITLLITIIYAATDEYHQTFIPGRVGNIGDVGIDALGAICACLYTSYTKRQREPDN